MTTLFISDLHLDRNHPEISKQFFQFLTEEAANADVFYVLGDLFEAWIGDDDPEPEKREVIEALRDIANDGVECYFMHGNRDFLIGERFSEETGFKLLKDPTLSTLYDQPVLIMHGDLLCTDDIEYQAFRRTVRDPEWQNRFLALDFKERASFAQKAREGSRRHMDETAEEIMDVNQDTVEQFMNDYGVDVLLHGHTHRPAVHEFRVNGRDRKRIVLGDWYTQGSVLRWDESGFELTTLPR